MEDIKELIKKSIMEMLLTINNDEEKLKQVHDLVQLICCR